MQQDQRDKENKIKEGQLEANQLDETKEDTVEQELEQELDQEADVLTQEDSQEEVEKQAHSTAQAGEDKSAEYLERLQRLMAEFDNYRKRSEKEKQNMYDLAVSETVTDLLGVIDNFERALKQECADQSFYKGIGMIHKQLVGVLENLNVETIKAEGEVFNPNLHNAVFHINDDTLGENVIVEELQKGYIYKERVLRHSMVKVAN